MLTPQNIASKRFDKQMGGYRQEEVERFLQQVSAEYAALLEQKEELEKKMEVLAEQVEKYREDEDSLRSALIGAQKLGDSVIRDSKAKADNIIQEARKQADYVLDNAQRAVDKERAALLKMQQEVSRFKKNILKMYTQHLELIKALPESEEKKAEAKPAHKSQEKPAETVNQEQKETEHIRTNKDIGKAEPMVDFTASLQEKPREEAEPETPEFQPQSFGTTTFGEGFDNASDNGNLFGRRKDR